MPKRGRVTGNRRGHPRKGPKTRTGDEKSEGSSAKTAENADGQQKIGGVVRENSQKRGRVAENEE